jgi:hypothetical protein
VTWCADRLHRTVALGLVVGWGALSLSARLVAVFLFEVSATSLATLGATVGLLLVAAILAALPPAWKSAHADPLSSLHHD